MKPVFKWSRLETFSALEVYEILKARESVFVVEQNCPYQEIDDMDPNAWHLTVFLDQELVAYARVIEPGIKFSQPAIGRVMTLRKFRGQNIGRLLMEEAIRFTEQKYPGKGIKIGAQVYLQKFYASLAFKPVGNPYDEDGIPHVDMVRLVNTVNP